MAIRVEIDSASGFCGGVIRAIGTAERFLAENPDRRLYSLGAIVHNEQELSRLKACGLCNVDSVQDSILPKGSTLLIRAHGEPPVTYRIAAERGLAIIDCTCPVVLKLQAAIREAYLQMREVGGKVLIFGKIGHAEVLGLVGQTDGKAVVVESLEMLEAMIADGTVPADAPLEVFSQTTKDPEQYKAICDRLERYCETKPQFHNTICRQVKSRHRELAEFASLHSVVIFVAGSSSSNGQVLSGLCRSVNPRTYMVSSPDEIDPSWFNEQDFVGVSGATSTPAWLLEKVAARVASY